MQIKKTSPGFIQPAESSKGKQGLGGGGGAARTWALLAQPGERVRRVSHRPARQGARGATGPGKRQAPRGEEVKPGGGQQLALLAREPTRCVHNQNADRLLSNLDSGSPLGGGG